jgi:hypothetical protein
MVNINGNDYYTVAERLTKLHQKNNNVTIITEIIKMDMEIVVVKATVSIDNLNYSGHAQEIIGSNKINTTSALENAETSAVGRALAFSGIGVDGSVASADEIIKAESRSNGIVEQSATSAQINAIEKLLENELVTAPDKVRINKLLSRDNIDKESASKLLGYFYGHSDLVNGFWEKQTHGVLSERRTLKTAA